MSDLPSQERPRERLINLGHQALTLAELVAIVLGSGSRGKPVLELARDLLAQFGGLEGLAEASVAELARVPGMGIARATSIKAALALSLRRKCRSTPRVRVRTPAQAFLMLRPFFDSRNEETVVALLLDIRCHPIRVELVAKGGLTAVSLDIQTLFRLALVHQAVGVVLAHNHPSGDLTASHEDIEVTASLVQQGRLIGVSIDDHLIISGKEFVSLRNLRSELWSTG